MDRPDNLYKISRILLRLLNVRVTRTTSRRILSSENSDGSLSDLVNALDQWKIESIAVDIRKEQLAEIDFPAVAHMKENGHVFFIVLTNVKNGIVSYIDTEIGSCRESIDKFVEKWDGIILLVESNHQSGETNYVKHRREELFTIIQNWIPTAITIFCLGWLIPQLMPWSILSLFFLKLTGLLVSTALLRKEYGKENPLIDKICRVHHKTDCVSVLSSPRAFL